MTSIRLFCIVALLTYAFPGAAIADTTPAAGDPSLPEVRFAPSRSARTALRIDVQSVTVATNSPIGRRSQTILFDTEQTLHTDIADYNFDGHPDFAIWHTDDGKGTYSIYRIFTFSRKLGDFVELLKPACGDDFLNVTLLPSRKMLRNAYVRDNRWVTCLHRY